MELPEPMHSNGTTIVIVAHDSGLADRVERNFHWVGGRVPGDEIMQPPQTSDGEPLAAGI